MVLGCNLHSDGVHEVRYNSRCRILQSRQARLFEKWTGLEWQSDAWFLVRVQKWLPGRSFTFSSLCNELVQTPATFQIHMPGTPCGIDAFSSSSIRHFSVKSRLCDEGGGGRGLVLPGGGKDTDGLVVTGQTVDTGLDENQTELGVLVLAVALEVLADGNSLELSCQPTGRRSCDASLDQPS